MPDEKKLEKKEIVREEHQVDLRHLQPNIKKYIYDGKGNLIKREYKKAAQEE